MCCVCIFNFRCALFAPTIGIRACCGAGTCDRAAEGGALSLAWFYKEQSCQFFDSERVGAIYFGTGTLIDVVPSVILVPVRHDPNWRGNDRYTRANFVTYTIFVSGVDLLLSRKRQVPFGAPSIFRFGKTPIFLIVI